MTKNHMAEVAEMLGVEMGEEFEIEGKNGKYHFEDRGLSDGDLCMPHTLTKILNGSERIKKLPWRPKDGEIYYCLAMPYTGDMIAQATIFRITSEYDLKNLLLGNCYPTKEAAEADKDKFMAMMKMAQEAVMK